MHLAGHGQVRGGGAAGRGRARRAEHGRVRLLEEGPGGVDEGAARDRPASRSRRGRSRGRVRVGERLDVHGRDGVAAGREVGAHDAAARQRRERRAVRAAPRQQRVQHVHAHGLRRDPTAVARVHGGR